MTKVPLERHTYPQGYDPSQDENRHRDFNPSLSNSVNEIEDAQQIVATYITSSGYETVPKNNGGVRRKKHGLEETDSNVDISDPDGWVMPEWEE